MTDSAYYERPVLLDRAKHRHLRVGPSPGFAFAGRENSLFVAGIEFNEAMKEYAIVFTNSDGRVVPAVLLGLRSRENLFVDDEGRWTARYVPAFARCYPFVLAQVGEQMGVCVDEAFEGFSATEGEPLFDAQGGETPFLRNAVEFLQRHQREIGRTQAFCDRLVEAGLLREMNARADLKDGRSFTVGSLFVVDEGKLAQLPDATVLSLFRSGELHLISMHLASLSNMQSLVDRIAQRQAAMQPPPKPD